MKRDRVSKGRDQTLCMYYLKFYVTKVVRETFEKHRMRLGIFLLQGLKKNRYLKNTPKIFCNRRKDILNQNLKRLYDIYLYNVMFTKKIKYNERSVLFSVKISFLEYRLSHKLKSKRKLQIQFLVIIG